MATPTAPVTVPPSVSARMTPAALRPPARPQPRVLWPWPTFFLGVLAVIGVGYARPLIQPSQSDRLRRDLTALRDAVDHSPGEWDSAISLGKHVLAGCDQCPQHVGEARFLLGCVYLRKAEDPSNSDPSEAWQEARAQFEQAEQAGVSETDRPRLDYKFGKVLHVVQAEPRAALEHLLRGEDNDNPAERWQLLAEAHLRMPTPDLRAALEATRAQLVALPVPPTDSKTEGEARLRQADVLQRLSELEQARKTLERINSSAPPEIYLKSRFLLAKCYTAEGNFRLAAATWEQVKGNPRLSAADRGAASYELGFCYIKAGRPADALDAWRQAQLAGGDAQQAAALRLAEVQLQDPNERAQAIAMVEKAFEGVTKPDDYRNALLPAKDALAALEQMCQALRAANDFAQAGKIADLYARLTLPGKGRELPADVAGAWAVALLAEAKKTGGAATRHALEEAARKQLRKAAAASAESATPDRPVIEQMECLRRATNYFFKAQDKLDVENGLSVLERMTKLSPAGESDAEVVFLKAFAHQQLGHTKEAIESYRKIAQQPDHPNGPRARYQMALLVMDTLPTKREEQEPILEQVTADLEKNLDAMVQEKDPETHELSLFQLGEALYQRHDWLKAQARLDAALRTYPQNPRAMMATLMSARCSWFQASHESRQLKEVLLRRQMLEKALEQPISEKDRTAARQELDKLQKDWEAARARYRDCLEKAKKPFEEVENSLSKRDEEDKLGDGEKLTEADRSVLRDARFGAAESYFYLEEYPEAVRRYQLLRLRYEGQIEEVVALSQLWQCHALYLNELDKAKTVIASIGEALKKLPDTAFDGSSAFHKRDYWDGWVKQASAYTATKMDKK